VDGATAVCRVRRFAPLEHRRHPESLSGRTLDLRHASEYGTLTVNDLIPRWPATEFHHLKQIREALGPKAGIVD
jgi:hypothetical protein